MIEIDLFNVVCRDRKLTKAKQNGHWSDVIVDQDERWNIKPTNARRGHKVLIDPTFLLLIASTLHSQSYISTLDRFYECCPISFFLFLFVVSPALLLIFQWFLLFYFTLLSCDCISITEISFHLLSTLSDSMMVVHKTFLHWILTSPTWYSIVWLLSLGVPLLLCWWGCHFFFWEGAHHIGRECGRRSVPIGRYSVKAIACYTDRREKKREWKKNVCARQKIG